MNSVMIPQPLRLAASAELRESAQALEVPGLKLGQALNLVLGLKPGWAVSDTTDLPFHVPDIAPLAQMAATIAPDPLAAWGFPSVTLHDDADSLLSAVYPYRVQALSGDGAAFDVPAGPLLTRDLDRSAALGQLSEYLGIDLSQDYSYMLVDIVRTDGSAAGAYVAGSGGDPALHLSGAAQAVVAALPGVDAYPGHDYRLGAADARAFLKSFQDIGTHYVSQLTAGDRIFQVFAYGADAFSEVRAAFAKSAGGAGAVEGIGAIAFRYYTTPRNSATGVTLGYASERGKLRIASNSAAFATSLLTQAWQDPDRAGGDSIFQAFQSGTTIDLAGFQDVVPITVQLAPIGNLIPVQQSAAGRYNWNRLLKGALLQKYGRAVTVTFPADHPYGWRSLLSDRGNWVSTIATPTVNAYSGHLDLDAIQLTNRDAVQRFSTWSVVLEHSGTTPARLPGTQVSLTSYLIDTASDGPAPMLELSSDDALRNVALACGRMAGALRLGSAAGPAVRTIVDGVLLDSTRAGDGRAGVDVTCDLFGQRAIGWLGPQCANMNFAIVQCQTLLYARGATAAASHSLARDCLAWIAAIIPDSDDLTRDLATIRLRSAYLSYLAGNLDEEGTPVPYLNYGNYKDYISAMAQAASEMSRSMSTYQLQLSIQRNAELSAKNAEQINANVKASGKLLQQYIAAMAANQGDISANYQSIINTKQGELRQALANFSDLAKSVSDQTDAVRAAKLDFERAMNDYQMTEIIKAVVNISTAFVTVGIAIVTPASTINALKELGETAQNIQKLITVLNAVMKLEQTIEDTVKNMNAVTRTMDMLKDVQLSMPSAQAWSEMSINFDASLASVPSAVNGPKAAFSAAFKILVLRAQAMLTAQARIAQINSEIALNKAQMAINTAQQTRLDTLTEGLNLGDTGKAPDLSEVDLLGLTGLLQSQLNQALAGLARALTLQDSAVQFELLAAPTPIQQFDLSSLQVVMASQQANILTAKEAFNPPPSIVNDPIQVRVRGVPVSQITGGKSFQFTLQPSIPEFSRYNMVRVLQVLVDIPGLRGSASGHYRIDLSYQGSPFEDRDANGQALTFNTVTRHFGPYQYDIVDGKHALSSGGDVGTIGSQISAITPFSTWNVQLPKVADNASLDFGGEPAVDIVLSFRIEALAERPQLRMRGLPRMAPMDNMLFAAEAEPASEATLDKMLDQMYNTQAALKGWDCVLNMLEQPVNQYLAAQYQEKYSAAKPMTVACGFCTTVPLGKNTVLAFTSFTVELGPPLLAFQANNNNFVEVTQPILSGSIKKGSKLVAGKNASCPDPLDLNDPDIDWEDPQTIDVSSKPRLDGTVGLGKVQGLVQPKNPDGTSGDPADAHSVILDFSKGSFVARNLNIDTDDAQLNLQLSNWFVNNPIQYIVNTVVFNDISTLKSLQPTRFLLNVLTTNSKKNILQLFITTTGNQQSNLTINVNEPIPDGYHNSLMVNTKIMFEDIFVKSFNKQSTDLQVACIDPGDDFTTWKAQVTKGTVTGQATFNNTRTSETRISASGNSITWPLDGLVFDRTKNLGISLTYTANRTVNFQHRTYNCSSGPYGASYCSWSSWNDHSVDVNVTVTGNYSLAVTKTGLDARVQIATTLPNVTVTPPDLKPTGPCECNDNDLKIQVGEILRQQVPVALKNAIGGITFDSVSVFALYNLLFPAQDFIMMKAAYVPGDLVILGTFNKYVD